VKGEDVHSHDLPSCSGWAKGPAKPAPIWRSPRAPHGAGHRGAPSDLPGFLLEHENARALGLHEVLSRRDEAEAPASSRCWVWRPPLWRDPLHRVASSGRRPVASCGRRSAASAACTLWLPRRRALSGWFLTARGVGPPAPPRSSPHRTWTSSRLARCRLVRFLRQPRAAPAASSLAAGALREGDGLPPVLPRGPPSRTASVPTRTACTPLPWSKATDARGRESESCRGKNKIK